MKPAIPVIVKIHHTEKDDLAPQDAASWIDQMFLKCTCGKLNSTSVSHILVVARPGACGKFLVFYPVDDPGFHPSSPGEVRVRIQAGARSRQ